MYYRLLLSFAFVLAATHTAIAYDPGRIAIIDASDPTDSYLDDFKKAGVLVIGRYMGRCRQWDGKRMIDNADELKRILDSDFAALSIYQYYSDHALKFVGKKRSVYKRKYDEDEDRDGKKAKARDNECPLSAWPAELQDKNEYEVGLSLPDKDCYPRVIRNCQDQGAFHTGKDEAEWDVQAALDQAHAINQPAGSAIYFGVDFDVELKKNPDLHQGLIEYFTIVSNALRADTKRYLVGAYGNGAALELLVQTKITEGSFKGRSLIDLTWFNASPGHDRTSIVYNGDKRVEKDAKFDWDLFQSRVAVDYPSSAKGMPVDLDIQNKKNADKYAGFWKRNALYKVPKVRTTTIFDQRRFACNGKTIISGPGGDVVEGLYCGRKTDNKERVPKFECNHDGFYPSDKRSRICFGALTRVKKEPGSKYVKIDCDEDGTFEGWTAASNLGRTMSKRPIWVDDRKKRLEMTLDRSGCDK